MIRKKTHSAVALTAVAVLALAACADDDDAAGTGDDTSATDEASQNDESPVVIGNVGFADGPHGVYQRVVQAWADVVNANGGIDGRPVRIEVADDGDDPIKHLDLVEEMVEKKGAVAFVAVPAENTMAASVGYLEERGIPVVGGSLGNPEWGTSPILFPQGFSEVNRATVITRVAATTGKTKYTLIWPGPQAPPKPARAGIYQQLRDAGAQVGVEFVALDEQFQASSPDYEGVCRAAQAAGIELMTLSGPYDVQSQLTSTCAAIGFKPIYVGTGTLTDPALIDAVGANAEGIVGPARTAWTETEPADLDVYRDAMAANDIPVGANSLDSWAAARILEEAIRGIDGEITPTAIADALRGLDGEDLAGLVAPIDFGASATEPNLGSSCFWVVVAKDGEFSRSDEGQLCLH